MSVSSLADHRAARWMRQMAAAVVIMLVLSPYLLLAVISAGSVWTFPNLLPDRWDFVAWSRFFADRDGMMTAVATSASMCLVVAALSTIGGLLVSRFVRSSSSSVWRFLIYLPFVVSPMVVGICLYDLLIRLQLAGTIAGVILIQMVFALAFASVFFSELWDARTDRLESLVANLGGNTWDIWWHAIFPQARGLFLICFVQTALFCWLDYALVAVVGGGQVTSVTMKLFAYIREASISQAAQSSLVLLVPALTGFLLASTIFRTASNPVAEHNGNDEYREHCKI